MTDKLLKAILKGRLRLLKPKDLKRIQEHSSKAGDNLAAELGLEAGITDRAAKAIRDCRLSMEQMHKALVKASEAFISYMEARGYKATDKTACP